MKNTHIKNLAAKVPKELRLEVYKEALAYYEQEKYNVKDQSKGHYGEGLCLVLPGILWGLYNYLDFDTVDWHYVETPKAFPELATVLGQLHLQIYATNENRMKYLREWIKNLEADGN